MRGYVANTDYDWYSYLKQQADLEEVNFWQPSGERSFRAIQPGGPFFFKLKQPHYAIAGYGFYRHHSVLPAWLAWDAFGGGNGAENFEQMRLRIEKYRKATSLDPHGQYKIGCLLISQPVFFEQDEWIEQPRDWSPEIVQGKTYDLTVGEGRRIWEECQRKMTMRMMNTKSVVEPPANRYGNPMFVSPRLGQGIFRVEVMDAYGRACAVTEEHSLPALEAAHIKPYGEGGNHAVPNGLLMRSDIHALFDRGYVTVTPKHRFEVSKRLKQDFDNGRSYYPLNGKLIHVPSLKANQPDPALLDWHNQQVFLH